MLLPDPRIEVLRGLGLTEYQARAYASLAGLGRATATQLARAAGVPRNKLYHTLGELNALGLVATRLGEVQTFAALPVATLLDARRRLHDEAMRALEAQQPQIEAMFPLPAGGAPAGPTHAVVHGREAALAQLARAVEGAEQEVLVLGGPATARLLLARGLAHALAQRGREGVRVRVVVPGEPGEEASLRAVAALLPGAVRVGAGAAGGALALVADGRVAVQVEEGPSAGPAHTVGLVSDATMVGATLARAGQALWDAAIPAEAAAGPAAAPAPARAAAPPPRWA